MRVRVILLSMAVLLSSVAVAKNAKELTADEIVARNAQARGGVEAWRHLQTMIWTGQIESDSAPMPAMAFTLEQKRPNKTRFEMIGSGSRTMRIYDGAHGYRVRARREGGPDIRPYSPEELKFAHDSQAIDGPLIDYQAKGSTVRLVGREKLENDNTYHLTVQFASGESQDVWVDAKTFLEVRIDRPAYSSAATGGAFAVRAGSTPVYYRNYKSFDGIQIPTLIEIGGGTGRSTDKMQIERVALNMNIDDRQFERPGTRRMGFAGVGEQQRGAFMRRGLRPQAPAAAPAAAGAPAADTGPAPQ
jgi:hypothetical protein